MANAPLRVSVRGSVPVSGTLQVDFAGIFHTDSGRAYSRRDRSEGIERCVCMCMCMCCLEGVERQQGYFRDSAGTRCVCACVCMCVCLCVCVWGGGGGGGCVGCVKNGRKAY